MIQVGIMQPYFFPYIGYFQLINCVDVFIIYDNIKYTKKGWINRNRMLLNGKDVLFSLPLKGGSDALDIYQRDISLNFDRDKLLNQIKGAYRNAPYFEPSFCVIERVIRYPETNLFKYIHNSVISICEYLLIDTTIKISSTVPINHNLRKQDKVLALCEALGATSYVNPIGGTELYAKDFFISKGINLAFIQPTLFEYTQFDNTFVPWLSIIDVMMFNSVTTIKKCLNNNYKLI